MRYAVPEVDPGPRFASQVGSRSGGRFAVRESVCGPGACSGSRASMAARGLQLDLREERTADLRDGEVLHVLVDAAEDLGVRDEHPRCLVVCDLAGLRVVLLALALLGLLLALVDELHEVRVRPG